MKIYFKNGITLMITHDQAKWIKDAIDGGFEFQTFMNPDGTVDKIIRISEIVLIS